MTALECPAVCAAQATFCRRPWLAWPGQPTATTLLVSAREGPSQTMATLSCQGPQVAPHRPHEGVSVP
jgi:hypothetical protein